MRIGYVLKKFPRLSETFILTEMLGLEAAGLELEVLSLNDPDEEPRHADLARLRARPIRVESRGSSRGAEAGRSALAARLIDLVGSLDGGKGEKRIRQGLEVARIAKDRGIDHLHAHFMTVSAQVAALSHAFGGPTFTVTAHAKDIFRHGVSRELFATITELSSGIVTVSDFNRGFIADELLDGRADKVHRIYNGLPVKDSEFAVSPTTLREDGLVLGVGRLVEKKGFDLLLRSVRRLVDDGRRVRCVIVGDGEERPALEALAADLELGSNLSFEGAQPREKVLDWMRRASVLALPCRTGADGNRDALPTVLIEALALGLPAVSTPVAGVPEIIESGVQGLIVPESDEVALTAALARVLTEPEWSDRCRVAGPARARALFDRDATLPFLVELFAAARGRAIGAREVTGP